MNRKSKTIIGFTMIFFLAVFVLGQEEQANDDEIKKLREQILSVYKAGGEKGLLHFFNNNRDKITNKFIVDFAEAGINEEEEWLKVCEIIANENKDEKTLADVLYSTGNYFELISENKRATDYFDRALPIYIKLNDQVGQGNIYLQRGVIYLYTGDNLKALAMYDKALTYFEKERELTGQGNVCLRKGVIYSNNGETSRAFEMYDKALIFFEEAGDPIGQGNAYLGKGDIYYNQSDNLKALAMYDKALPFFEETGEPVGQGNVYFGNGNIYFITGDNSKALTMYDKALIFFEEAGDPIGQGNIFIRKGDICYNRSDNLKALTMYDKALSFFEKAGDPIGQGNVYFSKGEIYFLTGEYLIALGLYDKALSFFEEIDYPLGQGNVYLSKGNIYFDNGEDSKALEMYDKALAFFEKIGDPLGQGNVFISKGDINANAGNILKALEMFNKAFLLFEKVGSPINQGTALKAKGDLFFMIGAKSKALECYNKTLVFFKKVEEPLGLGNVYVSIGDIYFYFEGDKSKALKMYDNALPFFEQAGDKVGQGNVYQGKGDIYLKTGDNSKALAMYNKALFFFKKSRNIIGQGNVNRRIGDAYFKVGSYLKSLSMYEDAIIHYIKAGAIQSVSFTLYGKAKVLMNLKKDDDALAFFEKGISYLEKIRAQTAFSEMKRNFMEMVYDQYEKVTLFMLESKHYKKGFEYIEKMTARIFLDRMGEGLIPVEKGLRPELKEEKDRMVGKLSALTKQMHNTGVKEKKKMSQLKEEYRKIENELNELLIKIRLDNPLYASVRYPEPITVEELKKDVLKKGEVLVRYFISPEKLYVFMVSKKSFKVIPLKVKKKEIKSIVKRYLTALTENNYRHMKRYGKRLYQKVFQPLEKDLALPSNTNKLASSSKGGFFVKSPQMWETQCVYPNFPPYFVENSPQKTFDNLKQEEDSKARIPLPRWGSAHKLRWAIRVNATKRSVLPFYRERRGGLAHQKETQKIFIIPDGDLAKIPFESLIVNRNKDGNPVYLMEKYRLKYIQSASVLSVLRKHYQRESETQSFIGFGDPVYDYENYKKGLPEQGSNIRSSKRGDEIWEVHHSRYTRDGGILNRLKGSGEAVNTIANLFKKYDQKGVVHLRDKASEKNAKAADMKDFDFIHFACHGLLNEDFQSLVLSQLPPEKSKEDGYLTLNEIMNCDYNAKLVVLSACRTGSGKMERGEGVTGLTRAVMYAGTPAVVASLWETDDRATKELMVKLYQNMLEKNLDKSEALRQAKLGLIKSKRYASPIYWSAFVMYGE